MQFLINFSLFFLNANCFLTQCDVSQLVAIHIHFVDVISIVVDQEEFDQLCNDISSARSCYQNYAHQSTATLDGKWKCIIIKNQHNEKRIILYTAGRMFPLYAAFSE